MGIHGFTTFIDNNLHLLQKHQLHGTKLIIDGNNLYHLLYYEYNVSVRYGGDYDRFGRKARHFFETLISCNITPYVVFDGGYDVNDMKLKTTLERAKERIRLVGEIGRGWCGKVMPVLAYESFRQVLCDMGIAHCVCDFEADSQIAVLADEWNCPVMSYDSDFYIFKMRGGYVPFDSVDLTVHTAKSDDGKEYKYLASLIYYSENFANFFPKLKDSVLPFIATLLGNDFVDLYMLRGFYLELGTPRDGNSHFNIPKHKHRMYALFKWLENLESIEYGIQKVLKATPHDQRKQLENVIMFSMNVYSDVHKYSHINLGYILEGRESKECVVAGNSGPVANSLPLWFRDAFWKGNIAQTCQNVIVLQRVILQCQIENISLSSTYGCSAAIRRVMYGILLGTDQQEDKLSWPKNAENCSKRNVFVTEYGREIKDIKKTVQEPPSVLEGFGRLPELGSIPDMCTQDRTSLLLACLRVEPSVVLDFEQEHNLLIAVIIFWVRSADPKVSLNQLKAIILCLIAIATNDRLIEKDEYEQEGALSLKSALRKSSSQQLEKVKKNLEKFCTNIQKEKKQVTDMNIVHNFSQFQACMLAAIHLNQLLLCPFEVPNPSRIFCGSFLYNFSRDLDFRPNVDLFIKEILVKDSPLLEIYNSFLLRILEQTNDCFCCAFSKKVPKRKRKNKKKSGRVDSVEHSDGSDDEDQKYLPSCQVSNRFMALNLNEGL